MRALRRIATPASVAAALTGCTYAFEDYLPRATDAGLAANQDAPAGSVIADSGVFETAPVVADTRAPDTTPDTRAPDTSPPGPDACVCVREAGGKCKEWSPPGCGD